MGVMDKVASLMRNQRQVKDGPIPLLLAFLCLFPGCMAGTRKNQLWSERMALSVIQRAPEPWNLDTEKTGKWEYTFGLVCKALLEVYDCTQDRRYFRYVKAYYDHHIDSSGQIPEYRLSEYNIDRINPGKPLFRLYRETGDDRYLKAIHLLRSQMKTHPRTSEGGFWHKAIYPHQMWLDGIYMASPFLAEYAATFNEPDLFDDVANQVLLMEKHARDPKTGLLHHGWDESRSQRWADFETGLSPHIWGRSMGWYAMALVDILDFFPADNPQRLEILAVLNRLTAAVVSVQDSASGLWYQVMDMGGREGNYPESSASSMLVYALAKAAGKGYLPPSYMMAATKGYQGILDRFIEVDADALVNIHRACAVAGLGGDPYRDGSYEYYIKERIRSNDPKAVGPFILASLEMEKSGSR
jgi:unsaturated rhamnogalacturonyl hydrolase